MNDPTPLPSRDLHYSSAPSRRRRRLAPYQKLLIALAALLLAAILGFTLIVNLPIYVEVGDAASLGILGKAPLSRLCEPGEGLDSIDTDEPGIYELPATLIGFIPHTLRVYVRDTTPPAIQPRRLSIMRGIMPEAGDFIESYEDRTEVRFTFESEPETGSAGEYTAAIRAEDEGGNYIIARIPYTVTEDTLGVTSELGLSADEIYDALARRFPGFDSTEIALLDEGECGDYLVRASDKGVTQLFTLTISDTLAPEAVACEYDIILGEVLAIEYFAAEVSDASDVVISCEQEPDFTAVGEQTVSLVLTDSYGNVSTLSSRLRIHNIPSGLTLEAGYTIEQLKNLLLADDDGIPAPTLDGSALTLPLGTNSLTLKGELSDMTVSLTVIDTVAPTLRLKSLTTDAGILPSPSAFVESCTDATSVTFTYESEPDVKLPGKQSVTIIATDAAGNQTRGTAELNVFTDTTPPVIYGVKNITAYESDTISYRSGVYAQDDVDGRVTVYVNSTKVNTSTAGNYTVTYTATDSSGNKATATATVTIQKVTQSTLNSLADKILQSIVTSGMSEREKAKAIYDWCRENLKYSTVTSYLMGNYLKAAYSGYKLRYGNCYTYYAVASSLLTRAGITNQMIQRNNPSKPHYWNLVKIDGSWYHFDTCPQPYPNNDGCFLLTDAEVAEYSRTKQSGYYNFNASKYPATP